MEKLGQVAANSQEIAVLLTQPCWLGSSTNFKTLHFPQLPFSAFTLFLGFRIFFSIPHFKCHQFEYFLRLSASQASAGDFTNLTQVQI